MAPMMSIIGELMAAALTERRLALEQAPRCLAEAPGLPCLHAEGLHDADAGDGLVQDVLDLGQLVLSVARGRAHPSPMRLAEAITKGTKISSTQLSLPRTKTTTPMKMKVKNCCRNSASTVDMANCTRSMSLTIADSSVPVEYFWKNATERRRVARKDHCAGR